MNDSMSEVLLRKVAALWAAAMVITSLAAISVVRADHKNEGIHVSAGATTDNGAGDNGTTSLDEGALGAAASDTGAAGASVLGNTVTRSGAAGGATTAASGPAAAAGRVAPSTGTDCPDYNPAQGVFCDHYTIGGTTVLSGPLAVYGDAGLKAGQAWLTYFNTEVAPREGLRKVKLIWYDDNLDPNKTLQAVQRMNEVDHITWVAGVTSPEAIAPYLLDAACHSRPGHDDCPLPGGRGLPFLGDFGLSPKSWTNPMIFPVIPNTETTIALLTKAVKEDFNPPSMAVINGTLPGVDQSPVHKAWEDAANTFGIKLLALRDMANTDADCSAQWSAVSSGHPGFIFMPVATSAMLACLRAAKQAGVQPKSPGSPWLLGWFGGSGLQVEVDNCRPTCEGMLSATAFRDAHQFNSPQMALYRKNMARYAPSVDINGFIPINYYHTGWVLYNLTKQAGIQSNITRKTVYEAANKFGPFETGFGDTITWRPQLPRVPSTCGYRIYVRGTKWVFDDRKNCL